jgi:hypothetical protein
LDVTRCAIASHTGRKIATGKSHGERFVRHVDDAAEWLKDHLVSALLYVRPNQGRQLVMNKRWFAAAVVIGNSPHTGA